MTREQIQRRVDELARDLSLLEPGAQCAVLYSSHTSGDVSAARVASFGQADSLDGVTLIVTQRSRGEQCYGLIRDRRRR